MLFKRIPKGKNLKGKAAAQELRRAHFMVSVLSLLLAVLLVMAERLETNLSSYKLPMILGAVLCLVITLLSGMIFIATFGMYSQK